MIFRGKTLVKRGAFSRAPEPRFCGFPWIDSRGSLRYVPRRSTALKPFDRWTSPAGILLDDKRFAIRTYGCQMNVHDSEKVATLLEDSGLSAAETEADADVLVINTCSIRDKAEHPLYSDLGKLREWKDEKPGRIVGGGGCVAGSRAARADQPDGCWTRYRHDTSQARRYWQTDV